VRFSEQESPVHCRRVTAEPTPEGQAVRVALYQALIGRQQPAAEMFGQRQVVVIISRWKTEAVVEMLGRLDERQPVHGSHALTQDIGDIERK
jgi:hypothetical protein